MQNLACEREWQNQKFHTSALDRNISASPSIYFPHISRSNTCSIFFYINFSLFSPRRRARSTLSALRLSKLSRRDETRLSRRSQILPVCFFFLSLEQPAIRSFWTKAIKRACRWRSYADSFVIPRTFVHPSLAHVVSRPYNSRFTACPSIHIFSLCNRCSSECVH